MKLFTCSLAIGFIFGQGNYSGLDLVNMKSGIWIKGIILNASNDRIIIKKNEDDQIITLFRKDIKTISTPNSRGEIGTRLLKDEKKVHLISKNKTKSSNTDFSISYGLLSEKNPFSFLDFSYYNNHNLYSESFLSINSFFVVNGLAIGYKRYWDKKTKSSLFISACFYAEQRGPFGSEGQSFKGLNISPGFAFVNYYNPKGSISKNRQKKENPFKKLSGLIGISFIYQTENKVDNPYFGFIPYFRIEKRY